MISTLQIFGCNLDDLVEDLEKVSLARGEGRGGEGNLAAI